VSSATFIAVPKWTIPLLQQEQPATTFVYFRLLNYMYGRDPYVKVKVSRLSEDLGYARETVSRQLKRLQAIGMIAIRRGAAGHPNEYIILLEAPSQCDQLGHDPVTHTDHDPRDQLGHKVVTSDVTHNKKLSKEARDKKFSKTTALAGRGEALMESDWFGTPLGSGEPEERPSPSRRKDSPTGLVEYFRDRVVSPRMSMTLGTHVHRPALMKAFKDALAKGVTPDELRKMVDAFSRQIDVTPLPQSVPAWKGFLARRDLLLHEIRSVHGQVINWDEV
jgi:hypothetical protein